MRFNERTWLWGCFFVVGRGGLFLHCHKYVPYSSSIHSFTHSCIYKYCTYWVPGSGDTTEIKSHSTCPYITSDSLIFMAPDLMEPACCGNRTLTSLFIKQAFNRHLLSVCTLARPVGLKDRWLQNCCFQRAGQCGEEMALCSQLPECLSEGQVQGKPPRGDVIG